jgi:triacylglycerol lipase
VLGTAWLTRPPAPAHRDLPATPAPDDAPAGHAHATAVGGPASNNPHASGTARTRELVVLVHGMGRTEISMLLLAWTLERNGYDVLNWGYSSFCCTIDELGAMLDADVAAARGVGSAGGPRTVHFVGHSLGSIIIRAVVARRPDAGWGRVVMLAPPNQGSHSADAHVRWLAWLLRPLPDIVTADGSTARRLPWPPHVPAGVIAGRYDGKVDVDETHLPGEAAHVVVPAMHTFIMNRPDVHRLTLAFLRDGTFGR